MRASRSHLSGPIALGVHGWVAVGSALLALALTTILCLFPELDFDIWWHLRTGRWILEEGRVPTTDIFSYTAYGRPWVTHEWGAEVLFAAIYRAGGIDALILFKALVATLAVGLSALAGTLGLARAAAKQDLGPPAGDRVAGAAVGLLLAAPLIAPRAFVRPHMLTALALGTALLLLEREASTGQRRWRAALCLLFLLWANLHAGFVLGLGLVTLYWAGLAIERRRSAPLAAAMRARLPWLGLIALATLANPHTWRAFAYPFALVGRPEVRAGIVELRSPFHPAYAGALFQFALLATALVLALVLVRQRRRIVWSLALPGAFFALQALLTLRGISEFAVLVPALVAAHGTAWSASGRPGTPAGTLPRTLRRALPWSIALLAAGTGIVAFTRGVPMGSEAPRRTGLGLDPANLPGTAVRFLSTAAPPGHVFHILAFGGYFIHELWPGRQTYIDGRLDVFPDGFIEDYRALMQTGRGWDEVVERHGIAFAVVDYLEAPGQDRGLRARLRQDPDWTVVCFSDNLLVYARRIAENDLLLREYGCPFDPSLRTLDSLQEWLRNASRAEVEQAASAIERMLPFAGKDRAPAQILASLLVPLAELRRSGGEQEGAAAALERAMELDPRSFLARLRLGILRAQAGDVAAARRHFEEAGRLRPDDPALLRNLRILESIERERAGRTAVPGERSPR